MRNPFKRDSDPFAPSRFGGGELFRSARSRGRKHMAHRWQWILLAIFLVVTLLAGAGIYKWKQFHDRIQTSVPTDPEEEGKPFNVLLVGSDSRGDLTEEEQLDLGADAVAGARADTLILGHVDPANDHVTMLQFPRDLYVPISGAGAGDERKIGEALLYGRSALVQTVEDLTGVRINRYVEINIAGFRDVVNAIDGVDVCVAERVPFDSNTGFEVEVPGTIHFDGDSALRYVRSRHSFPGGDFDRIANQQKFLSAALNEVTAAGTLLRPDRISALIGVAERNLRIDSGTDIRRLRAILDRFKTFDPAHYEAYVAPNFGTETIATAGSIVVADFDRIRVLGEAIANNESPAEADGVPNIDPSTVRVGVYNGVDLFEPYATNAADAIVAASGGATEGFQIADIANAPHFRFKETTIRYEAAAEEMAQLVAAVIPGAKLEERATPPGVDVSVIVGDTGVETETLLQILPIPLAKPGEEPTVCEQEGRLGDPHGG
jgi:LCP family protein required for cell wall assembly